jgi:hypothetical protein
MDLAFDDMHGHWSVLGLNRGHGQLLNILGDPMILKRKKVYFSRLMRACVDLIMLPSPGFLASYWSAGFGAFLQVSIPASSWLENCAYCLPTAEENDLYSAN